MGFSTTSLLLRDDELIIQLPRALVVPLAKEHIWQAAQTFQLLRLPQEKDRLQIQLTDRAVHGGYSAYQLLGACDLQISDVLSISQQIVKETFSVDQPLCYHREYAKFTDGKHEANRNDSDQ